MPARTQHPTARGARRRVAVLLAALAPVVGLSLVTAAPAPAVTKMGYDISWPQCPVAVGGNGLPMPPTTTQFVVIGLTFGLPFTQNPCVADQFGWSTTNSVPAMPYTMAAYPTAAQLSTYGAQGPWSSRTLPGRLSNVGYAEAVYARTTLTGLGWTAGQVWVDVEPRPAQPWPSATVTQGRQNRYVVEGLLRGLHDAGISYGIYSFLSGWQSITGSWWLPGGPAWATSGTLDYPSEASDKCAHRSVSGSRVYLSQWYDTQRDYDLTCGTYGFTTLPIPASSLSWDTADFNGDWKPDVLARVRSTGDLRLYAGRGDGQLSSGVKIGSGWNIFDALVTPGDFNGDGAQDVLAREASTGYLWLYPGNGAGGWRTRVRVGSGWSVMSAIVGPGDFNGDGKPDILARESSTGYLWLYPGTGAGGWLPRVRVGSGWNIFSAIIGAGDFNGDTKTDVLAREAATGYLWLYPGNGSGGWLPRVRFGSGWNTMTAVMSPGDLNDDRAPDLLARDAAGVLWLYPGNGSGGFLARSQLSTGWNSVSVIF